MLDAAETKDLKRLLELFPASHLRETWPDIKGTKEELCYTVAEKRETERVKAFVSENFSCCKQHIYIFSRPIEFPDFPQSIAGAEKEMSIDGVSAMYVIQCHYSIVLRSPLEETALDFLWPIKIELTPTHLILRLVVLERSCNGSRSFPLRFSVYFPARGSR